MPVTAPIMKVENCKRLGATVVIYGANFGEAKKRALQIGDKKKLLYVNGFVGLCSLSNLKMYLKLDLKIAF